MAILPILLFFGSIWNSFSLQTLYSEARQVRTLQGHEKALPLYQEILAQNPNDVTAATRIAVDLQNVERHNVIGRGGNRFQRLRFIQLLESFGWNCTTIADLVFSSNDNESQANRATSSSSPLFLQPLRAGTQPPSPPTCSLSACIQLLLLAVCIPKTICVKLLGNEFVELLEVLGIAFVSDNDENLLVPYVHVFPITVANTIIYVATDLHPNVLSLTTVGNDGAVMYIGPDSVALIDHWSSLGALDIGASDSIIDIGTGSGVQALSLIARSSGKTNVKCVDINKRALRITRLNFDWNNFDEPTLLLGNINQPFGTIFECDNDDDPKSWKELFGNSVTYIISNPPFLPVPINNPTISSRYGWFSSGGLTGEEFLESLVRLASNVLDRTNPSATLAVVSEFMNPHGDFDLHLSSWWSGGGGPAEALLLTNEQAISATTYAQRRADSAEETIEWEKHLKQMSINHISPGLLFLKRKRKDATPLVAKENTREDNMLVDVKHRLVPKSSEGSIWTPTNQFARNFTRSSIVEFLRL